MMKKCNRVFSVSAIRCQVFGGNQLVKINAIVLICFLFLYTACTQSSDKKSRVDTLPFYGDASFTPQWLSPNDEELTNFHQIPTFKLTNQDGKLLTEKDFEGKIYITDFFFTICPGICPKMTKNMGVLQEAFLNDDAVLLLSHSVTPKQDSVPVLKQYAARKGIISDKWHLVTGEQEAIYDLGRQHYFVEEDLGLQKDKDEFLHTENFILVDHNRHIRGIYNGLNKTAIQQLIADVKTLQKEM